MLRAGPRFDSDERNARDAKQNEHEKFTQNFHIIKSVMKFSFFSQFPEKKIVYCYMPQAFHSMIFS